MSYKYLEDGTLFTAKELNDRFAEEQANVNDVTSSEIQHGALGGAHLPMLIGMAGQPEMGRNPQAYTASVRTFGDTRTYKTGQTVAGVDFDGLELGHDTEGKVSALLVLFNANVEVFCKFDQSGNPFDMPISNRIEDVLYASFCVQLRSGPSSAVSVTRTRRSISPGYAMSGNSSYAFRGSTIQPDVNSFKDVALRSVILPSDVEFFRGAPLTQIEIIVKIDQYLGTATGDSFGVKISKTNFTCIPIQAKVVTS